MPPGAGGLRLDRFLAGLPEVGSRAAADRLVRDGAVLVDGAPGQRSLRLRAGQRVELPAPPDAPEGLAPVEMALSVPYEDEHLLVVDKPAGLVTHPARGLHEATLVHGLLERGIAGGPDPDRPGVVHRLDRDTTGLLVLAKGEEPHRRLAAALRRRELHREYRALVLGRPPSRTGTIDAPLGRDPADPSRVAVDGEPPRAAVTHFELLEAMGAHSLLRVRLDTGRTHQIRVHLAAIGHPVAGDALYGGAGGGPGTLGLGRQALHAARLAFAHPVTGEPVDVASPLPADLEAAIERARGR